MAAKPTQDPKWVTSDDPNELIEPSPALKTNGVQSGGIWGREHLNWMFNTLSKWIDWVRSSAMDKDNNLNDVADKVASFNNIKQSATTTSAGVVEEATTAEMSAGTGGKFPDAATIKSFVEGSSVNGFVASSRSYFIDNSVPIASGVFTAPTNFPSPNGYYSFGPTGSGTFNTFSGLDNIPVEAKTVKLSVSIDRPDDVTSGTTIIKNQFVLRKFGTTNGNSYDSFLQTVSSGVLDRLATTQVVEVAVDQRRFELNVRYSPSRVDVSCVITVLGFTI